jgi:hypothetical protein
MALAFGFSIVHLVKTLLLLSFHYDSGPAGFKLSFEKKMRPPHLSGVAAVTALV